MADLTTIPDLVDLTPLTAMVHATVIGKCNTYTWQTECTTDVPPDAIAEAASQAMRRAWKAGEDPTDQILVIRFL